MQNTISLHKQLKRFQLSFAFLVINPRTASRNPCRYSSTKRLTLKRNCSSRRILSFYPSKHVLGKVYCDNMARTAIILNSLFRLGHIAIRFRNLYAEHVDIRMENCQLGKFCKRSSVHGQDLDTN